MGEASEISRAVAAVAALDARGRRAMYGRAVAFGVANTHCSSERERRFGALRLLTLATLRLPDVALYGELLHSYAGDPGACCLVARTLIGAASGGDAPCPPAFPGAQENGGPGYDCSSATD